MKKSPIYQTVILFCGVMTLIFGVAIASSGLGLPSFQSIPYRMFVGIGTSLFGFVTMLPFIIDAGRAICSLVTKRNTKNIPV
jgi:hypothetical protein